MAWLGLAWPPIPGRRISAPRCRAAGWAWPLYSKATAKLAGLASGQPRQLNVGPRRCARRAELGRGGGSGQQDKGGRARALATNGRARHCQAPKGRPDSIASPPVYLGALAAAAALLAATTALAKPKAIRLSQHTSHRSCAGRRANDRSPPKWVGGPSRRAWHASRFWAPEVAGATCVARSGPASELLGGDNRRAIAWPLVSRRRWRRSPGAAAWPRSSLQLARKPRITQLKPNVALAGGERARGGVAKVAPRAKWGPTLVSGSARAHTQWRPPLRNSAGRVTQSGRLF